MVADGRGLTFTVIDALGPSPHPVTWLTYQIALPTMDVFGVGAVDEPVPPVATSYHNRPVPFAVKGPAGSFSQIFLGDTTPGAVANAFTYTVIAALGPSQPFTVWLT